MLSLKMIRISRPVSGMTRTLSIVMWGEDGKAEVQPQVLRLLHQSQKGQCIKTMAESAGSGIHL